MAVLGHDLRSPLASVMVGAQVLANDPGADVAGVSAMILRGGARMQRMIDDLLDVARVRLGQGLPLQPQRCDLGLLGGEVVLERQAAWPGRTVETSMQGDLGGRWDGERLRQLLANLLGNALQHGAAEAPVHMELDGRDPDGVRVTVGNAGAIPPNALATLFDPFRGAGARTREQGLGLGFYIVQQIVQAHGGRLDVASSPESGTRVSAWLPRDVP